MTTGPLPAAPMEDLREKHRVRFGDVSQGSACNFLKSHVEKFSESKNDDKSLCSKFREILIVKNLKRALHLSQSRSNDLLKAIEICGL